MRKLLRNLFSVFITAVKKAFMRYEIYTMVNNDWTLLKTETFNAAIHKGDSILIDDREVEVARIVHTPGNVAGRIYLLPHNLFN